MNIDDEPAVDINNDLQHISLESSLAIILCVMYIPAACVFLIMAGERLFDALIFGPIAPVFLPIYISAEFSKNTVLHPAFPFLYALPFLAASCFCPIIKKYQKSIIIYGMIVCMILATVSMFGLIPGRVLEYMTIISGLSNEFALVVWLYWLSLKSKAGFIVGMLALAALSVFSCLGVYGGFVS